MTDYRSNLRKRYHDEYAEDVLTDATFEEWLLGRLDYSDAILNTYASAFEDEDAIWLTGYPRPAYTLVLGFLRLVDWVREAGFKVRGRLGLYKPPF